MATDEISASVLDFRQLESTAPQLALYIPNILKRWFFASVRLSVCTSSIALLPGRSQLRY